MSSGKQDNTYTECWYRNVERHEAFKCPRLARIGSCKYTACDEANDMLNFKQITKYSDFSEGYHFSLSVFLDKAKCMLCMVYCYSNGNR